MFGRLIQVRIQFAEANRHAETGIFVRKGFLTLTNLVDAKRQKWVMTG